MESVSILIKAGFTEDGFRSSVSKMEHTLCGVSLLDRAIRLAGQLTQSPPAVLYGTSQKQAEGVPAIVLQNAPNLCETLRVAASVLTEEDGRILLIRADMPLLTPETLRSALNRAREMGTRVLLLVRNGESVGWCFHPQAMRAARTAHGDEELFAALGGAEEMPLPEEEALCVIDRCDLAEAAARLRERINERHMRAGVTMPDPRTVYIDEDVVIGTDVCIYPNNILEGSTVIGDGTVLYADNRLTDCTVGKGCSLRAVTGNDAVAEDGVRLGPYTHLRPHTVLRKGSFAGAFVEMKNVDFGEGSKSAHLSYVGDADVGKKCNIGCGVVFVNYDGKKKHRSHVGDGCFIGSNSNLVAPVSIEDRGFVAAGSTVTHDVPEAALCIARSRQTIKEGWVERREEKEL